MNKKLSVLYFASLAEKLNCDGESVETHCHNVGDLMTEIVSRGSAWQALNSHTILCAVNQRIANKTTAISDDDEVAFFPPVTGG